MKSLALIAFGFVAFAVNIQDADASTFSGSYVGENKSKLEFKKDGTVDYTFMHRPVKTEVKNGQWHQTLGKPEKKTERHTYIYAKLDKAKAEKLIKNLAEKWKNGKASQFVLKLQSYFKAGYLELIVFNGLYLVKKGDQIVFVGSGSIFKKKGWW